MKLPAFRFLLAIGLLGVPLVAQEPFLNWESPHVHPLELTPNGERLLAVNTADHRLELFTTVPFTPLALGAISVGLGPVSVRARTDTEAWVVNHVSDSVSIVDLTTRRVRATLVTDDEPADVVFAGNPERAFVSCSQANTILVFDPGDLAAPPVRLPIEGGDPRALAVSPGGSTVYAAIFESGNGTTLLDAASVSDPAGPYGGQNPPPNAGGAFDPPQNPANETAPVVGLIVRRNGQGRWFDDNGGDWTDFVSGSLAPLSDRIVGWDLVDHDIAAIDTSTLGVTYAERLMNLCMGIAVHPVTGVVSLVGTDARNEIRFEPNLRGVFLDVLIGLVQPDDSAFIVKDLNTHLQGPGPYPPGLKSRSLGDPRGILWSPSGNRAWVSGMGSRNVIMVNQAGVRFGPAIQVGEGPTGLALHAPTSRLFVLNRFEGTVSVVNASTATELMRVPFPDPTPVRVRAGRHRFYDTRDGSLGGQMTCASCHADARTDQLAWDLGDPSGEMADVEVNNLGAGLPQLLGIFRDYHPMKGPMTTQTLQDIIGKEPLHWRGDRLGLEAFNPAFVGLQGADAELTPTQMQEFEDFLATVRLPPNPFRLMDNSLSTSLPLPGVGTTGDFGPEGEPLPNGDATRGLDLFLTLNIPPGIRCVTCHAPPSGIGTDTTLVGGTMVPIEPGPDGERHHALVSLTDGTFKPAQLRTLYEKVGLDEQSTASRKGFGFLHDGRVDSVGEFASIAFEVASDQDVADVVAFLLSFSGSDLPVGSPDDLVMPPGTPNRDTHAAVGRQVTVSSWPPSQPVLDLVATLINLANDGRIGVIVKGRQGGLRRGWTYTGGGVMQSDRSGEATLAVDLLASASTWEELTVTAVPRGHEERLGVDRDEDGFLDRDELDAGSDPADPADVPGACMPAGVDLGYATPGGDGLEPVFRACFGIQGGGPADLFLEDVRAGAQVWLVASITELNVPFAGGTLVPAPDVVLGPYLTLPDGTLSIPGVPGLGGDFPLYLQWLVDDPGAFSARALSNALVVELQL